MIKRIFILAVFLVFYTANLAYGGYGVHKTLQDSDVCPVCHEHKPIGDTLPHEQVEYQFCTSCHGISAAGADTDVVSGIYDNPTGLNGTFGEPLNSGGFERVGGVDGQPTTSTHSVDGTSYPIFGNSSGDAIALSCTSCHDPDGSDNYRILKDIVNGKNVKAFVKSNEPGFDDSFSEDPEVYKNYVPNYTAPNYKTPDDPEKGITGWCAACHDNYKSSAFDVDDKDGRKHYYYMDQGKKKFRHAVNVAISQNPTGDGRTDLPLAKVSAATADNNPDNLVICLTCHRVHGTDASMSDLVKREIDNTPSRGPEKSTLLRKSNREVCRDCHKI